MAKKIEHEMQAGGATRMWKVYWEGQGDFVSSSTTPISHIVTLIISINSLRTKSP